MRARIQEEFDRFAVKVFPAGLSNSQYNDLRRTFFGGASALYGLVMSGLSPGLEATGDDLRMMGEIHTELFGFNEAVKRGER